MFTRSAITINILRMTLKLHQVTKHHLDINTATLTENSFLSVLYYLRLLQKKKIKCHINLKQKQTEILDSGQLLTNNPDKSQCKVKG